MTDILLENDLSLANAITPIVIRSLVGILSQ